MDLEKLERLFYQYRAASLNVGKIGYAGRGRRLARMLLDNAHGLIQAARERDALRERVRLLRRALRAANNAGSWDAVDGNNRK